MSHVLRKPRDLTVYKEKESKGAAGAVLPRRTPVPAGGERARVVCVTFLRRETADGGGPAAQSLYYPLCRGWPRPEPPARWPTIQKQTTAWKGCSGEREHGNNSVTCVRTGPGLSFGRARVICVTSPGNRIWLASTGGWPGGEFSFLF